jgi:23S rRNA pseudouridine1911/1915/1917 synthase
MAIHDLLFTNSSEETVSLDLYIGRNLPAAIAGFSEPSVISKSKIRRMIIAGAVFVKGKQERRPSAQIKPGETVEVLFDTEKFSFEKKPDDISFEFTEKCILFEDTELIIVDKPAGFPVEATIVTERDNLHAAIKRFLQKRENTKNEPYVGMHHRLDRETSGVILFTKTRAINGAIHELFLEHKIRKEYEALTVRGNNKFRNGDDFFVENFIDRITPKSSAGKWGAVKAGGEPARTEFRILEVFDAGLRVQALPITGRTHQIRVHLAGYGLPLLGDALYGGPVPGIAPRVMLHARKLIFTHPGTKERLSIEAPVPEDFQQCVSRLSGLTVIH